VVNVHVAVAGEPRSPASSGTESRPAEERDSDVTFLRTVEEGATDRSYGIHVANLAGVPGPVVDGASEVLDRLREEKAIEARGGSDEGSEPVQAVFDLGSGQFVAGGGSEETAETTTEEAASDGGGLDPELEESPDDPEDAFHVHVASDGDEDALGDGHVVRDDDDVAGGVFGQSVDGRRSVVGEHHDGVDRRPVVGEVRGAAFAAVDCRCKRRGYRVGGAFSVRETTTSSRFVALGARVATASVLRVVSVGRYMRQIKVMVPDESLDEVRAVLDDESIDYVVTRSATTEERVLVEFPVPTQAVEYILDELRGTGVDDSRYTVITATETAKTANFHELEDRFVAGPEEDDSVAPEEIRGKALGMHRDNLTYYGLTLLSTIVATSGLLLDSPAVVVGAMVIAPQVGSALISGVGIVLDDRRMLAVGFRSQVLGFALAIGGAAAFGFLLKRGGFVSSLLAVSNVSQVASRVSPGLLTLAVAICAGAAGALALATALPVSLVGVMIAAALVPAAAAVGIGLAWGAPHIALGAGLLLLVNAVAVNLSAFVVLWYLGYRPPDWAAADGLSVLVQEWETVATVVVLVGLLVAASTLLAAPITFERAATGAVEDVLEGPGYAEVELVRVRADVGVGLGLSPAEGQSVTVTVNRPADTAYPRLPDRIAAAIAAETDREVAVVVEFNDRSRTAPPGGDAAAADRPPRPVARRAV
jgi:uncharacterized hydrophobic protein (TIGR00341 family)